MFKRFSDAAMQIIEASRAECRRMKGSVVGTDNILLVLAQDGDSIAARALSSMGVHYQNVLAEMEHLTPGLEASAPGHETEEAAGVEPALVFSDAAIETIRRAQDQCRYFGQKEVRPEHILLGIVDVADGAAVKILEELGANLGFLRRQVMFLTARQYSSKQTAPSLRSALVRGLTDLIDSHLDAVRTLENLSARSGTPLHRVPDRKQIVHMVLLGYMPDLLCTQVAFQRHLLQETLKLMEERTGPMDREMTATIVSNSAQHLRLAVRSTIEYLWSNEYRLFDQVLNEAEHDLIGSVIEDLWWAQSEEIALYELFDEALVDHRRKQLLSLQKRRLEISQRITKLKTRLGETIQQCFTRRSISA